MKRYVLGALRNPLVVEGVTRNVFVKLLDAVKKYEPRATPFLAWLLRVERNAALDVRARRDLFMGEVHESTHDDLEADIYRSHELHHRGRAAFRAPLQEFNAGPVVTQNRFKRSAAV